MLFGIDVPNGRPEVFTQMAVGKPGTGAESLDAGLGRLGPFEFDVIRFVGRALDLRVCALLVDLQEHDGGFCPYLLSTVPSRGVKLAHATLREVHSNPP